VNVFGLPTPEEPLIDREKLAERLNVGVRTLDRWRTEPGFPNIWLGPGTVRFQESVVLAWLQDRHRRAA